jgi:hypothetical protein
VFDPRSFATDGLYPGLFSTLSFAVIGAFDVEVTIVPVTPTGGGGGYSAPIKPKYKIRIKVTRKNRVWNFESEINDRTARVIAKVLKIDKKKEPEVKVTSASVKTNEPSVKVKIK